LVFLEPRDSFSQVFQLILQVGNCANFLRELLFDVVHGVSSHILGKLSSLQLILGEVEVLSLFVIEALDIVTLFGDLGDELDLKVVRVGQLYLELVLLGLATAFFGLQLCDLLLGGFGSLFVRCEHFILHCGFTNVLLYLRRVFLCLFFD